MQLEKGYIYHIFNQGNNHRHIFFNPENHLFFLKKLKTFILPYADILAWCLMPNHFHLMVQVNEIELPVENTAKILLTDKMTPSHLISKQNLSSNKFRTFNYSIAIMLRSYTRAINKEKKFSGSLFKAHTKAECINCPNGITPSFISKDGISEINISNPEKEYPQICFDYIHQNPVKANLCKNDTDWEFSSAKDYAGLRNGKLINKAVTEKYAIRH